jgi:phenylalanyl-tRNA synthetase beta subunit
VLLRQRRIAHLLGLTVEPADVIRILTGLGFGIETRDERMAGDRADASRRRDA